MMCKSICLKKWHCLNRSCYSLFQFWFKRFGLFVFPCKKWGQRFFIVHQWRVMQCHGKCGGIECPDSVFYKYIAACCIRYHEIKIKWWYRIVSILMWIDTTEGFRVHVKRMVILQNTSSAGHQGFFQYGLTGRLKNCRNLERNPHIGKMWQFLFCKLYRFITLTTAELSWQRDIIVW